MTEQELQALSERNIALQEVVKAVKDCDGKRAVEACRQAIEWQAVFETREGEKNGIIS